MCRLFFLLVLVTPVFELGSVLSAGTPRTALEHFEKDLQVMAKSPTVSVKAGSFVDRLASKRRLKEAMEQDLATVQQEVDQLKQEIAQCETVDHELDLLLIERSNRVQQQTQDFEALSAQLVTMRESFQSVTPQDT